MPVMPAIVLAAAVASRVGLVSFQRLPIPDDVPAHLCSAIAQDAQGLMWFGTQGGLVRYDGAEFRVFRSNEAEPSTLAGNYVRALLPASDGRLWVGTFSGGLSVFDPRTEKFSRIRQGSLPYDRVESLAEDRGGRIWIATTAGLSRIDPGSGAVAHFRHDARDPRSLADDRTRAVLAGRDGTLWVGTRDGLQRWDGAGGFQRVAPALAGQNVVRLAQDRRGRIWVGTEEHGAAVLDVRTGALVRIAPRPVDPRGLSHYWVYGFAESVAGEMWVATFGGGVDVVDQESLAVVDRFRNDATLGDTIGADRVGAVFRDRAGLMWVGTWGEGIARHDPGTRAFRALRMSPSRPDGLTHASVVRALETRDGNIWAGTNGNGIDVLDPSLRRVHGYRANGEDPHALADGSITCLAEASDGTVWVATLNSMLHRMRPGTGRFDRIDAARLPGGPVRAIAFGRDGTVWAGAAEGMVRVDPATLATRVYRKWPGAAESSPAIEAIAVGPDGALWVGTDNGLYAFDPRTESAVRIANDARADGLPDNWVPDLMFDRRGRLWVGTAGGAAILTRWDGRTAHFARVAERIRRPAAPAEALIEDAEGYVWIGPRLRIDADRWTARAFDRTDGAAFRNYFIASRARTRDGSLLFGSPEGLLIVDPASLNLRAPDTSLVATALQVEGRALPGAPLLREVVLAPAERNLTVRIAPTDFMAGPRLLVRHRLEGLERRWIDGGAQRTLTYSRLPPGRYVLRVAVTDREGNWSPRELRLGVDVLPAMHQTGWFRALMAILALGVLSLAYRMRVRQLRSRERALEKLVEARTRELATAYRQIEEVSLTDPLTGLRNRRFLEQSIGADLDLAARGHGDLIVLLADLDHFKSVNDTHGHAAGDAVLKALADLLVRSFRTSDYVVRWGGEEFLIVVRFVDRASAAELAEKLRRAVSGHTFILPDGTALDRTCSIGFAAWPAVPPAPWEAVIDRADAALYEAKRGGRNACVGAETLEWSA